MDRFICLLRSVNVSGVNIIKMEALRAFFESFGFQNVTTYIQSGNIIFDAKEKPSPSFLEEQLKKEFNTKNVAVLLRTPQEMETILLQNPFAHQPDFNTKKLYIYYLETIPDEVLVQELTKLTFEGELFSIKNQGIYVYYKINRGRAKLSNAFFEKKLRTRVTARNWNTTNKLFLLATNTP